MSYVTLQPLGVLPTPGSKRTLEQTSKGTVDLPLKRTKPDEKTQAIPGTVPLGQYNVQQMYQWQHAYQVPQVQQLHQIQQAQQAAQLAYVKSMQANAALGGFVGYYQTENQQGPVYSPSGLVSKPIISKPSVTSKNLNLGLLGTAALASFSQGPPPAVASIPSTTDTKKKKPPRSKKQSSQYRGVSRCKKDGRFQARIRIGKDVKYLGRFKTEKEAALKYDEAARKYHKERALPNFAKDGKTRA